MPSKFPEIPFIPKTSLLLAAALLPSAFVCVPADAAVLGEGVSQLTYTDFAQNCGRYQAGEVNALLAHIRERDGGVLITYTSGQASYALPHGMIDFGSQSDGGYDAAIGYNFLATVEHNGVLNPTYSAEFVGSENAVHYYGIEYRESANNTFRHVSDSDYKITRLSKIVTDAVTSQVYTGAGTDLDGALIYRAGSGTMYRANADGSSSWIAGAYIYNTGGIMSMAYVDRETSAGDMSLMVTANMTASGISEKNPLPFAIRPGDSGSPCWVYNEDTGTFQYVAASQSGGGYFSQARGAPAWSIATMASYDKIVDLSKLTDSASSSTVYVNAVDEQSTETISDSTNGVSTNYWFGDVTDAGGNVLTTFRGVQTGVNTWKALNAVMDSDTWYAYDNTYLNASSTKTDGKDLIYADLYDTDNLVFKAAAGTGTVNVVLNATVDTGIGYTQFSKADGVESASFNVSAANGTDLLNTAGFVVDAGVSVTLNLNVSSDYVREWRKVGEGELHVAGSGDNYALLNLGGAGTTYLERTGGFAAYNVLANTGTTVVINDVNQIARDFTFGNGGATLDFNGNSMTWNNAAEVSADGFHIRALTEDAIITNTAAGTTTTLTVTDGGASFLGSFVDTAEGALKIVYDGENGANSSWTLNSIFTNLKNNAGSGFTVQSGSVTLAGTNTVHAEGSATGTNADRYTNADDWHYADMKADVAVENGATFTLGSHARLTGDVAVADGGTFVMNEGVKHRYEYIEGGYVLEDTNEISEFFGLKGNVALGGGNANLKIEYSAGTTAAQTYAGNITGSGNVSVALGTDGATLTLSGQNTFAGTKTLTSGGLLASSTAALGDVSTNKWKIESAGWLAVGGDSALTSEQLLGYVDSSSTGVLALTGDRTEQIDVSASHTGLIIGAAEGKTVQYGAAGTTETLNAVGGKWTLGGGGGELVVNFKLTGGNDLVLGNEYGKGAVTLTNADNDFTGTISFVGGVTLNATSGDAFGNAKIDLSYTNRATLTGTGALSQVPATADGVLLLDRWADETLVDLSNHTALALGADGDVSFDAGKITVATDGDYRFGGTTGTLTLTGTLAAAGTQNGLVVDAQTYSGGKIVLESAQTNVTGTVSVMGYDSTETASTDGEITLSFSAGNDDALANAAGTTVSDGGVIDLAGTTQTFQNLSVAAGGTVTDSAGTGTLVVSGTTQTLAGSVSVKTLILDSGVFTFDGDGSVSTGTLQLTGGAIVRADNANALKNVSRISVADGKSGTLYSSIDDLNITSAIDVSGTGALTKLGTNTIIFSSNDVSISNLVVSQGRLQIRNTGAASGASKTLTRVELAAEATLALYSGAEATAKTPLGELALGGATAMLRTTNHAGYWQIGKLSLNAGVSSATLTLDAAQAADQFSVFELGKAGVADAGNFAGTIELNQTNTPDANQYRSAAVVLSHETIAQNAVVKLGSRAMSNAVLAVGVNANATVAGLSGGFSNSALFSGTLGIGQKSDSTVQPSWIQNGAARTLTIAAAEGASYEFAGNVVADANGNALSIVKTGAGTQSFSGESITLGDVSALGGTLTFSGTTTVGGNVAVASGATLSLGDSFVYSLSAGKTFSVLGAETETTGTTATFASTLLLAGGELVFAGTALQGESVAALSLGGIQFSDTLATQTVSFTESHAVDTGTRYFLASGDWSAFKADISAECADYLSTNFEKTADGLYVTFSLAAQSFVWEGTGTDNSWTSETFGAATTNLPGADATVYFNERGDAQVNVSGSVSVGALVFEGTQDYTISTPADGATLTAGTLTHDAEATTTLGAGVSITETTTISAGELVVQSAGTLAGAVSGAGTLGVDWSGTGAISGLGEIGTLHVRNGQYSASSATQATTIRVDAGGQYWAQDAISPETANFILSGAGWRGDSSDAAATLRLSSGATIDGNVSLESDSAVLVAAGESGAISGALDTGAHTLTKVGAGTLTLMGTVSGTLAIGEDAGTLNVSGAAQGLKKTGAGTLTVTSTGKLAGALGIEAGTLEFSGAESALTALSGAGTLSVNGENALSLGDMSAFTGRVVKTGTGPLSVGVKSDSASWTFVGDALMKDIDFNAYAGDRAEITLVGVGGSEAYFLSAKMQDNATTTFAQDFVLTKDTANNREYGLYVGNGYTDSVYTFTGKFTGDGKFQAAANEKTADTFVFAGDVSEFSGGFQVGSLRTFEFTDVGGTASFANANQVLGTGEIIANGTVILAYEKDYAAANVFSGTGTLEKTGAGTLTLTNVSTNTLRVSAGTLVLKSSDVVAKTIVVSGGELDLTQNSRSANENGAGALTVSNGGVVKIADLGWGAGTNFGANYNADRVTLRDGGVLDVSAAESSPRGFRVAEGTGVYRYSSAGTHAISKESYNYQAIHVDDGATLRFDVEQKGGTVSVERTIGKCSTFGADATIGATTGSVEKTGAGTLRLSGENFYSGGTTISAGTLVAESLGALGSGAIRIEGGQLQIASGVTLAQTDITIVLNAANQRTKNGVENADARAAIAGESAAATASLLSARSATNAGTLADGTKITIALSADQQSEIAGLTAGSAISYYLWDTGTLSVGTNDFAADATSFSFVGDAFASNLSTAYDASSGLLTITAVPEPSAFGLLAGTLVLALAASARRRRRKT